MSKRGWCIFAAGLVLEVFVLLAVGQWLADDVIRLVPLRCQLRVSCRFDRIWIGQAAVGLPPNPLRHNASREAERLQEPKAHGDDHNDINYSLNRRRHRDDAVDEIEQNAHDDKRDDEAYECHG